MAALFPAFLSAIGASAAPAAAATGAATTAAGGFASLASIASIGSTVVGGLSSLMAGKAKATALNQQAFDEDTKAVQETITGRQDALAAMQKLNQDMAKITVAGFASGLSGDGSIQAAQDEAKRVGEANINTARNNAAYSSAARRGQAKQLRVEARGASTEGLFGAIQGGLSLFSRRTARG